jgi:hypothetical protein
MTLGAWCWGRQTWWWGIQLIPPFATRTVFAFSVPAQERANGGKNLDRLWDVGSGYQLLWSEKVWGDRLEEQQGIQVKNGRGTRLSSGRRRTRVCILKLMPPPVYGSGIISSQVSHVQALHTYTHTFGPWPANLNTHSPQGLLLYAVSHDRYLQRRVWIFHPIHLYTLLYQIAEATRRHESRLQIAAKGLFGN